jgi:hypothetical protein
MIETLVDLPIFWEDSHSYIGTNGKMKDRRYTSCTTKIHKFEVKKDWTAIATGYARKHGGTPDYWLAQWKLKNEESCSFGSGLHLAREMHWKMLEDQGLAVFTNMMNAQGFKQAKSLVDLPIGTHSELLLWSEEFEVAGQADIIIIEPDRKFRVRDYKSNIAIKFEGFRGETLLEPLSHIPNANYHIYCIQLSTYAYLLERQGYELIDLELEHITDNNKIYKLPYLRDEVINMLKYAT